MKNIPDHSVDLVLADPPYGTTACKWDSVIPLEPMWKELKRITKPNSAIRKLKPINSNTPAQQAGTEVNKLNIGNIVMHERFGKGTVVNLEGIGGDRKAEIKFDVGGLKKLLLRFAKLDIIG